MKTIFIIFFPLLAMVSLSETTKAQIYDTIPCLIPVIADSTRYWDYREANGKLLWARVKGYDQKLIPKGGYAVQGKFVNKPSVFLIDAYSVRKEDVYRRMITIFFLADDRKTLLKKPLMIVGFELPTNGFDFIR